MSTYLTTTEVAKRARVKYHTLMSWLYTGKVSCRRWPRRHWGAIRWTEREAQRVCQIAEARRVLLRAGFVR